MHANMQTHLGKTSLAAFVQVSSLAIQVSAPAHRNPSILKIQSRKRSPPMLFASQLLQDAKIIINHEM
jgi:hypothetical protein